MRKQLGSPPEVTPKQPVGVITQVREYQLITPLYGGGVEPTKADPITVVRATEVRGQLRFWWRACRGGQYGSLTDMKGEEDAIWGKAHKKGDPIVPQEQVIQIIVEPLEQNANREIEPFRIERDRYGGNQSRHDSSTRIPAYAAFPLQHSQEELQQATPPHKKVRDNVKFRLTISFPSDRRDDVAAALWAWETFGGIGARTRRGFGALRCISIKENEQRLELDLPQADQQQAQEWIRAKLKKYVADGTWVASVPHLGKQGEASKVVRSGNTQDSWTIWRDLIDRLRSFRQRRQPSTKPNQPGRSMWPEPSEIRRLTGQSLPPHSSSIPNPPINKFPRAAFGLPIIFQFKDRDRHNHDNPDKDPRQTVLQLTTSERLASPLILKPLACQGGAYVGLAVILEGTGVDEDQLILKTQKGTPAQWPVKATFDPRETLAVAGNNSGPSILVNSTTNALQDFLRSL